MTILPSHETIRPLPYPAVLGFEKLSLPVLLGNSPEERLKPQNVQFHVKIFFQQLPSSCLNDKLEDTVCYDNLAQQIKSFCQGREFHLIEYLCYQLHAHLRGLLADHQKLWIEVEKCQVPVPEILGSARFSYGDL